MKFIFQMARREMRSSWRRLLFFFISIGIGVAAIVTVRSMIQTRVIVMAVGLGAFLVITVWSLQRNLLKEFDFQREGGIPDLVLLNVEKEQESAVTEAVGELGGRNLKLFPVQLGRLVSVDGRAMDFDQPNRREGNRGGRYYRLTYRAALEPGETVVEGKFWDPTPSPDPEVSIGLQLKRALGVDVGGTVTFDVEGRRITASVTSVRQRATSQLADVVFRPGTLEAEIRVLVGTLNGPGDQSSRARFQRELVDRFPTMSIIDNNEVLGRVQRVVHNITLGISLLAGLILASGALILVGSIAMTKFQRVYEIAVMKTLGARRKTLIYIMLAEYGLMGLVAGIIGSVAGAGLSYVMSQRVLEIHFHFAGPVVVIGIVATAALVTVVGATASYDALAHKPLAVLRAE